MAEIHVVPAAGGWNVRKNGGIVSDHRLKRRATEKARSVAKTGDQLVVHGENGQVQNSVQVR